MNTILWPQRVALVCKKSDATRLDFPTESDVVAYALGFSKEAGIQGTVTIEAGKANEVVALEYTYKCPVWGAYYLPRITLRPLEGKMLPKGELTIRIEGEILIRKPLSFFLPDPEPIDCLKAYPWSKTKDVFLACSMTDYKANAHQQIGFMPSNGSQIQIRLFSVDAEEKVTLEVSVLSAYYSTKQEEMAQPDKKETTS